MTHAPQRALSSTFGLVVVLAFVVLAACAPNPRGTSSGSAGALALKPVSEDSRSWAPKPVARGGLTVLAEQRGSQSLLLHTQHGDVDFWAGVNLGSTTPGHSPGELAISREEYRRWLTQMGQMGVHTLRIYTIHPPVFYEELKSYNQAHPDAPIYLVQGVYVPGGAHFDSRNLFDPGVTRAMVDELADASKAVHGDLVRGPLKGRASGTWTADVSKWVAAWIVGVEWDGRSVAACDAANRTQPLHEGRYFTNTKDASPTERWIAARMDELAADEAARGVSVPIALVNWPTTDPLRHPAEPLASEDAAGVDANHVVPTKAWPGGTFASFHAYPYYPDFLRHQSDYTSAHDPYLAYLLDLKKHFAGHMPLMVTEFGVPSSLGSAHSGTNGRAQGNHSEQEAFAMDAAMLKAFKANGFAGGLLFSWVDEWFKVTWNTLPRQKVVDGERQAVWHDPLTNEQYFGIVAQDSKRVGQSVPWEAKKGVQRVTLDHDASWVYLTIDLEKAPTAPVAVGFDLVPGGLALPPHSTRKTGANDYAVTIDPKAQSATMLVAGDLDPVRLDGLPTSSIPAPGADGWSLERMTTSRPVTVPLTGERVPVEFFDVGHLKRGSWDPASTRFDNRSTWELQGKRIMLRLPWSMLGLGDPSSKTAVVVRKGQPVAVPVRDIAITVAAGAEGTATFPLRWEAWNRAQYTERVKAGAQTFTDALVDVSR